MLGANSAELVRRADNFLKELRPRLPSSGAKIELVEGESLAGGGSTPSQTLHSPVFHIRSEQHSAAELEKRLRRRADGVSIIARIENDHLVVDLRTVFEDQEPELAAALAAALR
jgi:L-seryl-tRNA(Ser) seleniumtransferase